MSKIFKLRRGSTSIMNSTKSNILLSSGEMFLEVPSSNSGNSDCRIKVGDGETQYSDLDYAIGGPNMTFRDNEIIQESGNNISSIATTSSTNKSTFITAINQDIGYITSNHTLGEIVGSVKSALSRTSLLLENFEGGSGGSSSSAIGSIFIITTDNTALYNQTVTITDEDSNTFSGVIDNTGYCEISGIDSIGDLSITATDTGGLDFEYAQNVVYFSKYIINLAPLEELIPTMSSNIDNDHGSVICSSAYGGSYVDYYAFDNNTTTGWAGRVQSGNYIGYHFTVPVRAVKGYLYSNSEGIESTCCIQASDDGSNWVTVSDTFMYGQIHSEVNININASKYYFYYRLLNLDTTGTTNTFKMQLYGHKANLLIPLMTSDSTPSGIVTASSAQSSYPGYKAFDRDISTCWNSTQTTATIQYKFDQAVSIIGIYAYVASNNQTVSIEGSSDGSSWNSLGSFTLTGGTFLTMPVNDNNNYLYIKATVTKQAGNTAWLHSLQFYG